MYTYTIQLKTIEAFRKYADLNIYFNISGYLLVQNHQFDMYDILDIMESGVIEHATLVLTKYCSKELPLLTHYLEISGLKKNTSFK